MPRRSAGHVERRPWKDGETVTWRLHVSVDGRPYKIVLGTNHEGWTEDEGGSCPRAEIELEKVLEKIRRGTWRPPERGLPKKASAEREAGDDAAPETIHVTLSRWWQTKRKEIAPNTVNDYRCASTSF